MSTVTLLFIKFVTVLWKSCTCSLSFALFLYQFQSLPLWIASTYLATSAAVLSFSQRRRTFFQCHSVQRMMESRFQIWAEKFLLHCYIWNRRAESVPHPLCVVDHSVYRSSAHSLSMFVYVVLSLSLDHHFCIWRGSVFL